SRAVIVGLQQMGATRIVISNRTDMRSAALAQEFGIEMMPWTSVVDEAFAQADLVVNAAPLAWRAGWTPVRTRALSRCRQRAVVMDLIYRSTLLLETAAKNGHEVIDGHGMLLHQGARAFELWTGQTAPLDVMRSALEREQARQE